MAELFTIQIDEQKLKAIEARVADIPNAMRRLVPRALNRAITAKRDSGSTFNLAARRLTQALGLHDRKRVAGRIFTHMATGKGWFVNLWFGIGGFKLFEDYAAIENYPSGTRIPGLLGRSIHLPRAFFATMKSGHDEIFMRAPAGGGKRWSWRTAQSPGALVRRLPIAVVKGPTPEDAWNESPQVRSEVAANGQRRAEWELHIEAENEIAKKMPK
jgi:hypothetical protein